MKHDKMIKLRRQAAINRGVPDHMRFCITPNPSKPKIKADNLSKADRKRIDEIKDQQTYRTDVDLW